MSVATALRQHHPNLKLIFASDNDRYTKGNPGLTKARIAANAVGGSAIWPVFPSGVEGTDFNDLVVNGGTINDCQQTVTHRTNTG